jgi:hypothetical protein
MAEDQKRFLQQAEEAEANAAKAVDHHVKRQFLNIAEQWRRLANSGQGRWGKPTKDDDSV